MLQKPEVPWDYNITGGVCELRLPRVAIRHRIVLKNQHYMVLVREKDGEVWCLAHKKSLEEAQDSILRHCRQFCLWRGQWVWGVRELRVMYQKPEWL